MLSTQLISPSVRYTLHGVSPPTSPDRTLEGHNKSDRVRPGDLEPEPEALASMRADLQTATQQIAEGTAHLLATQQLVGGLRQGLDTNQQRMKEQTLALQPLVLDQLALYYICLHSRTGTITGT